MAKLIVQHDTDPGIAVIVEEYEEGYYGTCTQCGEAVIHHRQADTIDIASAHVDRHEAADA